ncbi:MAG: LemA family protein [Actinobacteria bacterium]|nr:LemA family protein [Actinomycetota bacterium]
MGKKLGVGCIVGIVVLILVIVGLGLGAYIISSRNNMVEKELSVENAWAQVQNVYQRRLDLIPNLAESAKAYMQLEKDIFEAIANARAGIQEAENPAELESANQEVSSLIDDIKVIVEDTPELKASETVQNLMIELEGTENRIATERGRYNETIRDFNVYIRMFPRNIIAGWFGFTQKDFFEAQPGAETAPEVDLELE